MPKLPQISGKVMKRFQIGKATLVIPQHKIIKKGTLSTILKDAGMSVEKLKKLL